MDGFTGLNPSEAKSNIDAFVNAMNATAMIFLNGGNALFGNLKETWCSPRAVEFGDKFSYKLYDNTVAAIEDAARLIARNAETAYNTISIANGGGSLGANYGSQPTQGSQGYFGSLKESGASGIVGMNMMQVELALVVYGEAVEKGLAALAAVPTNIAFYDPNGEQQATYKAEIEKVKNTLEETINSMLDEIEAAMETEHNSLVLAKENATSALSGNA